VIDESAVGIEIEDARRKLDSSYHSRDLARAAGVIVGVDPQFPVVEDEIFADYKAWAIEDFQKRMAANGGPVSRHGVFTEEYGPGPISVLKDLAERSETKGQAAWSALLLKPDSARVWMMSVTTGAPFDVPYPAPHIWAIEKYGLIHTSWGLRRPVQSLHPALGKYAGLLPVATNDGARRLRLDDRLDAVPLVVWKEFLGWEYGPASIVSETVVLLVDLVARALRALPPAEAVVQLPAVVGSALSAVDPHSILIAADAQEEAYLQKRGLPYLRVDDSEIAELLVERAGCGLASSAISFSIQIESESDSELLLDRYIGLRDLGVRTLNSAVLIRCGRLARRVTTPNGIEDEPVRYHRRNDTLYVETGRADEDVLSIVSRVFDLHLSQRDIDQLLRVRLDAEVEAVEASCRAASSDIERLQILLSDDELEARLPAGLLSSLARLGVPVETETVPKLFLDVWGFDSLRQLREELDIKRLEVPHAWSGSSAALKFVKKLGFSSQFAGERGSSLARTLTIPGKPELDPLHDYQEEILRSIRTVLESPRGAAAKAMVELPTGAGKTRVTVEAVVRSFLAGRLAGPVLWIAQSEELCEQAVQTWSEVWRDFSDKRTLIIGRLWSDNEVAEPDSDLSVIVATDGKLDNLRAKIEYEWLSNASAVIVDEAHVAGDAPTYTRVFRWLGVDGRSNERPLLGLSATPFKGDSQQRTERLVARFGKNLISVLGDDPYGTLQDLEVLARVDHEVLDGAQLELSSAELRDVRQFSRLSSTVLEKVATNEGRTSRLIEHIMSLDPEWPVLVFTSSVLSAQIVAALLNARGVTAASVSGETRRHERRRVIAEFRKGNIRVLTNCDVLTQGFDAPGVRALYIARPTLSPNAYIQMAGRGLRGRLNGGSDRCLIVDLADTFSNLGGELAYRKFDELWNRL
jgi:superfamily II DNA or RNA helicase